MKLLSSSITAASLIASAWLSADIAPGEAGWPAEYPAWWYNTADPANGVINATLPVLNQDNDAVANLGQAKHVAQVVYQIMESTKNGSAGPTIREMILHFSRAVENNDVPLNIGQLKALSAPFYDVMHDQDFLITLSDNTVIPKGTYPWNQTITESNFNAAKIGQLKHVFSFDLKNWKLGSPTWDKISDEWKLRAINDPKKIFYDPNNKINNLSKFLPDEDYDGDGLSNYQEFLDGTDPIDFFNGEAVELVIESGDGQVGLPSTFMPQALKIRVLNSKYLPLEGAPVKIEEVYGTGRAAFSKSKLLSDLNATFLSRSNQIGLSTYYYAPSILGTRQLRASMPNGDSVLIHLHIVDLSNENKIPISEFRQTANDRSTTFSWISNAEYGDWFQLESRQTNGTWLPIYQTTYGSKELPYISGKNSYSITLDYP